MFPEMTLSSRGPEGYSMKWSCDREGTVAKLCRRP